MSYRIDKSTARTMASRRTSFHSWIAILEESGAGLGLNGEQEGESDHGRAAVEHLGLGGEEGELLLLDALQDWDQGSGGEHDEREQDGGLGVPDLLEDGLPGGGLGAQSGDEAEHGQSAVDGLGGAAGEGHGVSEGWGLWRWWWWWWWGGGVALRGRDLWLLSGADGDEPGAVDAAGLEAPGGESEGGRGDGLGGEHTCLVEALVFEFVRRWATTAFVLCSSLPFSPLSPFSLSQLRTGGKSGPQAALRPARAKLLAGE